MRPVLAIALLAGCGGLNLAGKNHCVTQNDCVMGICVAGLCQTDETDLGISNDAGLADAGLMDAASLNDLPIDGSLPGRWRTVTPMPTKRSGCAAVFGGDGRLYVLGGSGGGTTQVVVEAYTPATDSWTTLAPMLYARNLLVATLGSDGRIYAIGGDLPPVGVDGAAAGLTAEAYTITSNTWTRIADLSPARYESAAVATLDGRIYVFGGNADFVVPDGTMAVYELSTNKWSDAGFSLTTARKGLAGASLPDGRIFAIGGFDRSGPLAAVEFFTPGKYGFNTSAPLRVERGYLAATTGHDGRIYAIGGSSGNGGVPTVEVYTPGTNSWSFVADMPTARFDLAAATAPDGSIYVVGGVNGQNLSTIEILTP